MTDFNSEFDDAWALTQQQDGRLVVAGQSEDSQERSDFALARYNANGELDVGPWIHFFWPAGTDSSCSC